jgi:hypothetical protein
MGSAEAPTTSSCPPTQPVNERRHGLPVRNGGENNRSASKTHEFLRNVVGICIEVADRAELQCEGLLVVASTDGYRVKSHLLAN